MIFITYWELNPEFDPSELAEVAQKLISKKLWPVKGTNEIAWYVSATDYWGVLIIEAESEEQMLDVFAMWRITKPGMLKFMKTTPAKKVVDVLPPLMKLAKQIKG